MSTTEIEPPRRHDLRPCANRIERKLNKLDGVQASVNYATEKARVQAPADLDPAVLVAQVEAAGYTATLPVPPATDDAAVTEPDPTRPLRDRLVVSAVLAVPVIALAMVPALQFTYWQWISLTLAAPVAVWGALPFHRAAWTNLRHGATTMDTLVSTGVLAAFGWSLWALVFGTAGEPGMVHPFTFAVSRGDAAGQIYLEVAAGVTTFLLAGRYFEARSKRRAGAALRALLELGAKDVAVLHDGQERSRSTGSPSATASSCGPGEGRDGRGREEGRSAIDAADRRVGARGRRAGRRGGGRDGERGAG
jgi:Cu+-exporting ATPase